MSISGKVSKLFIGLALAGTLTFPARAEAPSETFRPPLAELWVQTSAEYRALSYQAYGAATEQFEHFAPLLEKRADGKAYLPGSKKPVAIILDLDETVIDNSGFQAFVTKTNTKYNPQLWEAWVEFQGINREAGATVPGAVDFLAAVTRMGVTPIFVSNRDTGYEDSTIKVLERAGVDMTDIKSRVLLRQLGDKAEEQTRQALKAAGIDPNSPAGQAALKGEGEKEGRRLMVQQEYDVVAYFGDVYGDFESFVSLADSTKSLYEQRQDAADANRAKWGRTWFVLPNPMYGPWGPGYAVPKGAASLEALSDFGFEVFLRGRRLVK